MPEKNKKEGVKRNTANKYAYDEHGLLPSDIEVLDVIFCNIDENNVCRNLTLQAIADLTPSKFCKTVIHRALKRLVNNEFIAKLQVYKKTGKGKPQYAYKILDKGLMVIRKKEEEEEEKKEN